MQPYITLDSQDYVHIGRESFISGELSLIGPSIICGSIAGNIEAKNSEHIQIESTASIKGTIKCHHISIYGNIDGEIQSTGKVSFYPTAKFKGIVSATHLEIFPGATVDMEGHGEALGPETKTPSHS